MSKYQMWIDGDIVHALRLIAQTQPRPRQDGYETGVAMMTADEMANDIIRKAIRERWPTISEHQKQVAQLEKELILTLK